MEHINKKWDLPTMEKKIENLKKIIPPGVVDWYLKYNSKKTESRLDALYLTFYDLKDKYCRINRHTFGTPKTVKYQPKQELNDFIWYTNSPYTTSSTWTITTSTAGYYSNYSGIYSSL